ncbi:hypothetical protein FBU59_005747 [Linderina macrospora]|uniref:Uncharacterized protein n=1 Tax=Linderina macrospora TaxID=4868 RepID=A0ACC1J241_9FUNG|nr:hypothetical protein FBU59_005747 [Linderina macrospora]
MGFKKPKTTKSYRVDTYNEGDDKAQRNLDPTQVVSGGGKASKRKNKNTSDAPKAFQHIMQFMEMKQKNDERKRQQKQQAAAKAEKEKPKLKGPQGPKEITEDLKIQVGETMAEFNRRVRQKMTNNLQLVGTSASVKAKKHDNPALDEGEEKVVSGRTERKRKNDAVRRERRRQQKNKNRGSDSEDEQVEMKPKFGEQAQAPPIFKALPKETFKKMVPLPASREEAQQKKLREELAVKKMIRRTARLSPLERMQAKRKAKLEGGSAAEKRIMEAEREQAIRRYRMLKVARESKKSA